MSNFNNAVFHTMGILVDNHDIFLSNYMNIFNDYTILFTVTAKWTHHSLRSRLTDLRESQPAARQHSVTLQRTFTLQRTVTHGRPPGPRHRQHGVARTKHDRSTRGDLWWLCNGYDSDHGSGARFTIYKHAHVLFLD